MLMLSAAIDTLLATLQIAVDFASGPHKLRAAGRALSIAGYLAVWSAAYDIRRRYAAESGDSSEDSDSGLDSTLF